MIPGIACDDRYPLSLEVRFNLIGNIYYIQIGVANSTLKKNKVLRFRMKMLI